MPRCSSRFLAGTPPPSPWRDHSCLLMPGGRSSSPILSVHSSACEIDASLDFHLDLDFDPSTGLGVALTPCDGRLPRSIPPADRVDAACAEKSRLSTCHVSGHAIPARYSIRDSMLSYDGSKVSRTSQPVPNPPQPHHTPSRSPGLPQDAATVHTPTARRSSDASSPITRPHAALRTPSSHLGTWATQVLPSVHSTGFFHHRPLSPGPPPPASRQRSRTGSFRARSSHLIAEILPRATTFRDAAGRGPGFDDAKSSPLSFVCRGDAGDSLMGDLDAFSFPPAPFQQFPAPSYNKSTWPAPSDPLTVFPRAYKTATMPCSASPHAQESHSPLVPVNTASLSNLQTNYARNDGTF